MQLSSEQQDALAGIYQELVKQYQIIREQQQKAIEALSQQNDGEYKQLSQRVTCQQLLIDNLKKALCARKSALKARKKGKETVASFYEQADQAYQRVNHSRDGGEGAI